MEEAQPECLASMISATCFEFHHDGVRPTVEPRFQAAQEGIQPHRPCLSHPTSIVSCIKEFDPLWEFLVVFHIPFVLSD